MTGNDPIIDDADRHQESMIKISKELLKSFGNDLARRRKPMKASAFHDMQSIHYFPFSIYASPILHTSNWLIATYRRNLISRRVVVNDDDDDVINKTSLHDNIDQL